MFQLATQGAVQVLSGDAPLIADAVSELKTLAHTALAQNQARMVLDFRNIPLIDSAGLELILDLRDDCLRGGGSLQLANPGTLCRDILLATGVAEQFAIFDSLAAAVGSYSR